MHDWDYFLVNNGNCHNINLELMLQRNSIDNPLYTRKGSTIHVVCSCYAPYSLFDGKVMRRCQAQTRISINSSSIINGSQSEDLLSVGSVDRETYAGIDDRVEYGFLGTYNKNKKSPFETFYMGGDGMSGYSSTYAQKRSV